MTVPIVSPDAMVAKVLPSADIKDVSGLDQLKSMLFDGNSSSGNIFSSIDTSHSFINEVLRSSGTDVSMQRLEEVQSRLEDFTLCTQIASKAIGQVERAIDTLIKIQ